MMILASMNFLLVIASSSSNDARPFVFCVFAIIGGIGMFYKGFQGLLLKREIENTPTSKLRSVAMGPTEVKGKIVPKFLAVAPVSGRKCVYYTLKIEQYVRRGKHSYWENIHEENYTDSFFISDGTGTALINPAGADFRLHTDLRVQSGVFKKLPPEVISYLHKIKVNHRFKTIRVTEIYLVPGDWIYVLGYASSFKKNSSLTELSNWLENTDSSDVQKVIKNSKQNNYIDPDLVDLENENLVKAVQDMARSRFSLLDNPGSSLKKMVEVESSCASQISKNQAFKWFVISDYSEQKLISMMFRKTTAMIWGGPILATAGLAGLLALIVYTV